MKASVRPLGAAAESFRVAHTQLAPALDPALDPALATPWEPSWEPRQCRSGASVWAHREPCFPGCPGWAHWHEPHEIEKCDECGWYDDDDQAVFAHRVECGCDWPERSF